MSELSDLERELTRSTVEVRRLVQDFPLCSTFREVDELNQEVRRAMDNMRRNIGKMETMAREETEDEAARAGIARQAEEHRGQLTACQRQFRQANVKQMTVLENLSSKDLLSSANNNSEAAGGTGPRKRRDKEQLVQAHGSVTRDLQAISRQLAETVDRSRNTVDSLGTSSQVVDETSMEYRTMAGVIGQSRKLISKYARRELTDKVLIVIALAFFFAVVLYILRKRVFPGYGPLELVIYLLSLTTHIFTGIAQLWPF